MNRHTPKELEEGDERIEEMHKVPGFKDWQVREDGNVLWIMDHKAGVWKPFETEWKICPTCRGNGTIVNPSIDGNGLSREDFDEDPDFEEAYFRGDYDISCPDCEGGKYRWTSDPEGLRLLEGHASFNSQCRAERDAERRMGC